MKGCRIGEAGGVKCHATRFGETQFGQDVSYEHIVDMARLDFSSFYSSLHDLYGVYWFHSYSQLFFSTLSIPASISLLAMSL
jgi:hypothetical protein